MRWRVIRHRDRWYVEDTHASENHPRLVVGVGHDHKPSNRASLTLVEATAIEAALNQLDTLKAA